MSLASHARAIWDAGVKAVMPQELVLRAIQSFSDELKNVLENAPRVIVVGAGKAGAAMAVAVEFAISKPIIGLVNVPEGSQGQTQFIRLHAARPAGSNFPTGEGVSGANEMLQMLSTAGPDDVAICLISGGGSALLPCPVDGVSLADKQAITKLLHASGASISEMNVVRKHLSKVKGGKLAEAFRGKRLISLIISDVVGDPLDVIASGPTTADPSTFQQAIDILNRYGLWESTPASIIQYLKAGIHGEQIETPKALPGNIENRIVGSNSTALSAARLAAENLGYDVLDLGPWIEGDTQDLALVLAGITQNIQKRNLPIPSPACILIGGETTVSLGQSSGKGGRNQEFVLAMMKELGDGGMQNTCVLSGGTDGEDGPTDAAGAIATHESILKAEKKGLVIQEFLKQHNAYPFFDQTDGLIRTGLTGTNVMDLRIILVGKSTL